MRRPPVPMSPVRVTRTVLMLALLGLSLSLSLSLASAFAPMPRPRHPAPRPDGAGGPADDYTNWGAGPRGRDHKRKFRHTMKVKDTLLDQVLRDQGSAPNVTDQFSVAGGDKSTLGGDSHDQDQAQPPSDGCTQYWARVFHTVGHPLNTTQVQLNALELAKACDILRTLGVTLGDDTASTGNGTDHHGDHGNHDDHGQHGPHPGKGTTVVEPSLDLIGQLGSLVGGDSRDSDDDDSSSDKSLMDKIQDIIDLKLNLTSRGR
ncbi:hypothetical protein EGW08_018842 [Elysia chlorotica]|uniref:Uncharacterized protein n=1 Tax=Elysia chlorotica TaxID=188477 RepID=A0A3S1AVL6_ELYCH|nr:hypothetical protein EGW08_018842 [Elysia chlorotica]